jgi:hypothetical protein
MPAPCARCNTALPKWELAGGNLATCTTCGAENEVRVFPAILQASHAPAESEAALEGEAACFDHPFKRALAACRQCGRFVCGICSVEFGDEIWCPTCIAAGAGNAREAKMETSRPLFDSMVLALPLLSLLAWPLTIAAAPAAIVLGIATWKRPLSIVRRYRWRTVLGMLIALAEMTAWTAGVAYFLSTRA